MEEDRFPDREEAVRRQRERLDLVRARVSSRIAYGRVREWFVASGAAARFAERAAAWVESAAARPDLEELVAASLSSGAARAAVEAVLAAVESSLSDESRLGELAPPIASWLDSLVSGDDFLWAVHSRLERMGGATGKIAHLTGAIDYHELTHQTADAIRAELARLKQGDVSGLRPAVAKLLSAMKSWDLSGPRLSPAISSLAASLFRAAAPAISARMRAADPGSIPPWLDDLLFAAWSRTAEGVIGAVEALVLPETTGKEAQGSESDLMKGLAGVMREMLKDGP